MKMMGVLQDFGEIEFIYCPDPVNIGKFIKEGLFKIVGGLLVIFLVGWYFFDLRSELLRFVGIGCLMDV